MSVPILVSVGPNVILLKLTKSLQILFGIVPAALNVTLVKGDKLQPKICIFKQTGLFITIVLTLLFPVNGIELNVVTELGIVILDKLQFLKACKPIVFNELDNDALVNNVQPLNT